MAYDLYDFVETVSIAVRREGFKRESIERCVAGWGKQGDYAEWDGGFILSLKDGRYAYISGWCDTTGWGCQDGVDVRYFPKEVSIEEVRAVESRESHDTPPAIEWDVDPTDCNRWLAGGIDD